MRAAESLAGFAAKASCLVQDRSATTVLGQQVQGGCVALWACAALARQCAGELSPQDGLKLAQACSLLFGVGTAYVEAGTAAVQAGLPAEGSVALGELCIAQLSTLLELIEGSLASPRPAEAEDALLTCVAPPAVLAAWLRSVCLALRLAAPRMDQGEAHVALALTRNPTVEWELVRLFCKILDSYSCSPGDMVQTCCIPCHLHFYAEKVDSCC